MSTNNNNNNLVKRNLTEIITEEEFNNLLKEKKQPVTYCGYETSGPVHIGTMVAINKQVDFQDAGFLVKVLFADVHTHLNKKGSEEWIENMVEYWKNCFIALGLDKAEFVRGMDFEFDKNYVHDVLELGLHTTLNRARRSMQDVARDLEHASVSQMIYPIMQIADIKALGVDIAHGGMEQRKIHALAREVLPWIDYKKPVCVHTPLLCSLQGPGSKMSSSKPETMISVADSPEEIKKKIRHAFCPPAEIEGNPVIEMCKYLIFTKYDSMKISRPEKFGWDIIFNSYSELEEKYLAGALHPMDLKSGVSENIIKILEPVRDMIEAKELEFPGKRLSDN
ncbi:MAG: tyrosine--tRNA ligase [Candidatus Altiarchaeales archaeon HGW-Altiarchaeales-3]|nr:MAG: tyrosine--tRNA ligase [Candidatus Altiarchaeales archaeon HGW-Altiarchaeales-3]